LRIHLSSGGAMLALLLLSTHAASARPMHAVASTPVPDATISGPHAQYAIRFDGPIDHAQSRLEILSDGKVVQRLRPLLDSAVDVLFASGAAPKPGHYVLHWTVKSVPDRDSSEGTIPFTVAE
jgi:methionine-rich copper-binding protein CopC